MVRLAIVLIFVLLLPSVAWSGYLSSGGGGGSIDGITCAGSECTVNQDLTVDGVIANTDQGAGNNIVANFCNSTAANATAPIAGSAGWTCQSDGSLYHITPDGVNKWVARISSVKCLIPFGIWRASTPNLGVDNFFRRYSFSGGGMLTEKTNMNGTGDDTYVHFPELGTSWDEYRLIGVQYLMPRDWGGFEPADSLVITPHSTENLGTLFRWSSGAYLSAASFTITDTEQSATGVYTSMFSAPVQPADTMVYTVNLQTLTDANASITQAYVLGCFIGYGADPWQ